MPLIRPTIVLTSTMVLSVVLAACATDGPSGSLPSLAAVPKLELPKIAPGNSTSADGTPTEAYTRIARGAQTCWFGANGPLKGPYIYHGEAAPPSKGGQAEIVVRTRDKESADPRSLKAFAVDIIPSPEGTRVDVENLKIEAALGERLKADVFRWSANEEGCGEAPVTAGWSAAPALTPATTKSPATPKSKPAVSQR
jgi:hypothetical protein